MCGIVGYTGLRSAQNVLHNSLERLEYRGYDSCGIAVIGKSGLTVQKNTGRVSQLISASLSVNGTAGIGHTRWASCGSPDRKNAHPHDDCGGRIAIAHNGNITNYLDLKNRLESIGHFFKSDTDSEVLAHLIEQNYRDNLIQALQDTVKELQGSFGIVAVHQDENYLAAACRESSLVVGLGDGENWIASDVTAFFEYTSRVIYLEDGDLVEMDGSQVKVYRNGQSVELEIDYIDWAIESAGKNGYEHYMLKEIHEQPQVLRQNIGYWLNEGLDSEISSLWRETEGVPIIVGCGSSYHAALTGKYFWEYLTGTSVRIELASEFNYQISAADNSKRFIIGLTQSGETADTIKGLKKWQQYGAQILAITNIPGSSVSRIAARTLLLGAGPEISVAATKTYIAQIMSLLCLMMGANELIYRQRILLEEKIRELPALVQRILDQQDNIKEEARWLADYRNVICIGRGIQYPVALEAALKLKEISYIHAEACAAGELKHGPLALVSPDTPVIAVFGGDDTREAMLTAVREVKVRGAMVLAIIPGDDDRAAQLADKAIFVPETNSMLQPVLNTIALQLVSYFAALHNGCPIDTPRHLAKSVTVQ